VRQHECPGEGDKQRQRLQRAVGAAGGLLAQALGLRAVFVLMAALILALCLGLLIVTDSRMEVAERHAGTDPDPD
jgi:hypothetical protein